MTGRPKVGRDSNPIARTNEQRRPGAWWRDDFTVRFAVINGLPGVVVDAPEGTVQTTAFEIKGRRKSIATVSSPSAA
jgi:RNA polymerase sigma-70 factor (ECF subfamily)